MLVLGCDLSLAATGLVVWDHARAQVVAHELVRTAKCEQANDLQMRVHAHWLRVKRWAALVDRIAMEAPAYGANHGDTRPIAVFEVVCYRLWRAKYCWTTVPATTVKKHATGKGNASKVEMVEAARLEGFFPDVPSSLRHNLVDAYWVARWYADKRLGGAQ